MVLRRFAVAALGLLLLACVYFVAAKLGLMLAFVHASATAVWPPTGIALAAVLVFGYRVWPAMLLGAFMANVTTEGSVATSLGIATGNTLEALVGALLVRRFANGRHAFERARDIFKLVALAGLLSTTVSATMGVTSLSLGGYADWRNYGAIWLTWWLGDAAGDLIVAPLLLLWSTRRDARPRRAGFVEGALLFALVVLVAWTVFNGLFASWIRNDPLEFLCIPPLVWAAFRFGQRESATAIALLSGIAIWGTLRGFGPFVRADQNESLLLLQAFMGTMAMMTLPLAAVVAQRLRAEEALARVAAIVESSDDAILGKTLDGIITSWNPGAERLYGYSAEEAIGQSVSIVIPPECGDELSRILERLRRGERVHPYETVRIRKDGTRVEVSVTASPTWDTDGRVVSASSIARDITQRKEAEAAVRERDRLRIVAGLATAAAHEINNPLTVVMGQAQLLAKDVDAPARDRVAEILHAGSRIQGIVHHMKHLDRLEFVDQPPDLPEMLDLKKSSVEIPETDRPASRGDRGASGAAEEK